MKKSIVLKTILIVVLLGFVSVFSVFGYAYMEFNKLKKENVGVTYKYTLKLIFLESYSAKKHAEFLKSNPLEEHKRVVLVVPKKSVREIAKFLFDNKLITSEKYFIILVRFKGADKLFKNGEFEFFTDMTPEQVLKVLTDGKEVQYKVTFPENITYQEMGQLLEEAEVTKADKFIELCESEEILKKYNIEYKKMNNYKPTLEGYLYPETYNFKHWTKPEDVIERLITNTRTRLKKFEKQVELSGFSEHEILTFASLIGKETGSKQELAKVSSVFHNRLKKKMLLQTDPTVIYMVTDRKTTKYHAGITKKHLTDATNPYNTYVYKGLPPGPIGNANIEAVEAVLFPAITSFIFFVSNNDGTHTFSVSLKDHEKAVANYWKKVKDVEKKDKK